MYVRLGLAVAHVTAFLKNPRVNANWEIKQPSQLKQWYNLLMGHIRTNQYGVFFAAQEIFGIHAADYMAKVGHLKRPDCVIHVMPQAGSSKANVADNNI